MKTLMLTDCKSLYDHLRSEGRVPDDKHTAIWTAALRGYAAAGPGQHDKTATRWVTSKWQLADCLTKLGLDRRMREIVELGKTKLREPKEAVGSKHKKLEHIGGSVEV